MAYNPRLGAPIRRAPLDEHGVGTLAEQRAYIRHIENEIARYEQLISADRHLGDHHNQPRLQHLLVLHRLLGNAIGRLDSMKASRHTTSQLAIQHNVPREVHRIIRKFDGSGGKSRPKRKR